VQRSNTNIIHSITLYRLLLSFLLFQYFLITFYFVSAASCIIIIIIIFLPGCMHIMKPLLDFIHHKCQLKLSIFYLTCPGNIQVMYTIKKWHMNVVRITQVYLIATDKVACCTAGIYKYTITRACIEAADYHATDCKWYVWMQCDHTHGTLTVATRHAQCTYTDTPIHTHCNYALSTQCTRSRQRINKNDSYQLNLYRDARQSITSVCSFLSFSWTPHSHL